MPIISPVSQTRSSPSGRARFATRAKILLLCAVAAMLTLELEFANAADVIHTEPSQFSPIVVYEKNGERCMNFGSVHAPGRQTCVDMQEPDKMVFAYTRMMMGALLLAPEPRRILIIGLGGGTLSRALHRSVPDARIDNVDIDPAVVKVAEHFFGFEPSAEQRVFVEDGRQFVEDALHDKRRYDLIMLDAFGVDYIPKHLMSREFLQMVHDILAPDGVLAANTFAGSRLYAQESATYRAVFGPYFNLRSGNRVILAKRGGLPDAETLRSTALRLTPVLAPFGVEPLALLRQFSTDQDWPADTPVITDTAR